MRAHGREPMDEELLFGQWKIYPVSWGICRVSVAQDMMLPDDRIMLIPFDTRTRSQERWRDLRMLLNWLDPGPGKWARACYKALRRYHNESREKSWEEALPKDIIAWANGRLAEKMADEYCADNDRVARVGNTAQNRRYQRQLDRGCCGFVDWMERGPDGHMYRLGFNCGH